MKNKLKGSLIGQDGNAFSLLAYFNDRAKRSGWTKEEIEEVMTEAKSSDYKHLLATLNEWFDEE